MKILNSVRYKIFIRISVYRMCIISSYINKYNDVYVFRTVEDKTQTVESRRPRQEQINPSVISKTSYKIDVIR